MVIERRKEFGNHNRDGENNQKKKVKEEKTLKVLVRIEL